MILQILTRLNKTTIVIPRYLKFNSGSKSFNKINKSKITFIIQIDNPINATLEQVLDKIKCLAGISE